MNIQVRLLSASAQAQIKALEKEIARLRAEIGATGAASRSLSNNAFSTGSIVKWGSQLQWAGRQLSYNFTLPIVAAGAASTKFALDNEKAITRLTKVYGDIGFAHTTSEVQALRGAFRVLSEEFAINQADVINIGASWAAAGVSGLALAKATKLTLTTMVLGEIDAAKATESLIAIQAQYRLSTDQLYYAIAQLNIIENQTGTSLAGLIDAMSRSAGTARAAGIDIRHLGAMIAAMTPAAGSAAQAGNALKTIISRLLAPTKDASALLGAMGIHVNSLTWQSSNASDRLVTLATTFNKLSDSQKAVVSSTLASRFQINKFEVLMDAIITKGSFYHRALDATTNSTEVLKVASQELTTVLTSQPAVFDRAMTVLKNAMAQVIVPLLPLILGIANTIAEAAKAFANMDPRVQKLILTGLVLLAVLGPILQLTGALGIFMGELGHMFVRVGNMVWFLIEPLWKLASFAWSAIAWGFEFVLTAAEVMVTGTLVALGWFTKGLTIAMKAGAVIVRDGMILIGLIFEGLGPLLMATGAWLATVWTVALEELVVVTKVAWGAIKAIWMTGAFGTAVAGLWTRMFSTLQSITWVFLSAVKATWTLFYGGVATLSELFFYTLKDIWIAGGAALKAITTFMLGVVNAIWTALMGTTLAIAGVAWTAMKALWMRAYTTLQALTWIFTSAVKATWTIFSAGLATISQLLFYTLKDIWAFGGRALQVVTALTLGVINTIWLAFSVGMSLLVQKIWLVIRAIWFAGSVALEAISTAMWTTMKAIWLVGSTVLPVILSRAVIAMGMVWKAGMAALTTLTTAMIPNILKALAWLGRGALAVVTGPWGIAIGAAILIFFLFKDQIVQIIKNIINYFQNLPVGVVQAFQPLVGFFNNAVGWVIKAFNMLPQGVQNAMMAVLNIVKTVAMKVYEWFSYLNPFAHHSPSLVENVTKGLGVVRDQFAKLESIKGVIQSVYSDIKKFGQLIANFKGGMATVKMAEDLKLVKKYAPEAAGAYRMLAADIKKLQPILDGLSAAIEKQQAVVDGWKAKLDTADAALQTQKNKLQALQDVASGYKDKMDAAQAALDGFANTPIQGMKAMDDAIFANEMASKKLRLEMMRMEDLGGTLDDLKNKMSSLNGEIELLQGTQKDLQNAGAGSDITSFYDQQIAALQGQKNATTDNMKALNDMQKALDALDRQAQEMDLEKSLAFDPLTRQIQDAANAMKELPFSEIMAGITASKAEIDKYTQAYNDANKAVADQQVVVDAAQKARDAISASYDTEAAKLAKLKDSYDSVAQAMRDAQSALDDLMNAVNSKNSAVQAAASGATSGSVANFNAAKGGNFPDVGGTSKLGREGGLQDQGKALDEWVKKQQEDIGKMFGGMDMFGPIREYWDKFTAWWNTTVTPMLGAAGDFFGHIFDNVNGGDIVSKVTGFLEPVKKIWDGFWGLFGGDVMDVVGQVIGFFQNMWSQIQPELEPLMEAIKTFAEKILKPWAAIIGVELVAAWKILTAVFKNVLRPVLDWIVTTVKSVLRVFEGLLNFITGVFTGDWSRAWDGIKTVFLALWDFILATLKGIGGVIWGVVSGLVVGVVELFKWLWSHAGSVITSFIADIINWFLNIPNKVNELIWKFIQGVIGFFQHLFDVLVGHSIIPDMINAIVEWFKGLPQRALDAITALLGFIVTFVTNVWNGWVETNVRMWTAIIQWFKGLPQKIIDGLSTLLTNIKNFASTVWDNFKSASTTAFVAVVTWVQGIPQKIVNGVGNLINLIKGPGADFVSGLLTGAKNWWHNVTDWVSDIPNKITTALGTMKDLLKNAGISIITGFWDGLKEKWKEASKWIEGLGQWISDHKGPKEYDLKLLVPNGNWIMDGLSTGLGQGMAGVKSTVADVNRSLQTIGAIDPRTLQTPSIAALNGMANAAANRERAALASQPGPVYAGQTTGDRTIVINGDLSFPNINSSSDAKTFIANLEALAGGS
jgi:TP901 family phage tail tape measure protein